MRRARRAILTLALAAIPAALPVSQASADADPASDVLLGSPAFFPYQPAVGSGLQSQLLHELASLRNHGLNLKVAIIESRVDLGAIPNMFGHPRAYAVFLDREISFNQPQPLLVVMPSGFGVAHAGSLSALDGVKIDAGGRSDGLTRSAITAVQRLAQAAGKPVGAGRAPSGGSGGGPSPLITFAAPAILVLLGAAVAARLHRRAAVED
jgi:hypothetical protein